MPAEKQPPRLDGDQAAGAGTGASGSAAIILETERLRLRELHEKDADFVLELVGEPAFRSNIGDKGVRNRDDALRFIREGPWTNQPRRGYGQFVVQLRETGEPVGICGLLYREAQGLSDIGFALLDRYQGRGYATEAARAMFEYGRSGLGLEDIVGLTVPENLASIRVLGKLGLRPRKLVKMSESDPGTLICSKDQASSGDTEVNLDHINISAPMDLLERVKDFYCLLFAMEEGFRPQFSGEGFWLYSGDRPLIHLSEQNSDCGGRGCLDHVAFRSDDVAPIERRLESLGVDYRSNYVQELDMTQIFFTDPAGTGVEVNCIGAGGT
jgi:RimJ/RimL family protein N-acetyltransferase/catechol 2,3-dioxygenase-like lactoylglutathione lyase family enzyme